MVPFAIFTSSLEFVTTATQRLTWEWSIQILASKAFKVWLFCLLLVGHFYTEMDQMTQLIDFTDLSHLFPALTELVQNLPKQIKIVWLVLFTSEKYSAFAELTQFRFDNTTDMKMVCIIKPLLKHIQFIWLPTEWGSKSCR